jgi:hypothetical protein
MSWGPQEFLQVLEDLHDCIFALAELLSLTEDEKAQLDEIRGDAQLTAVWWRRWRARRAA